MTELAGVLPLFREALRPELVRLGEVGLVQVDWPLSALNTKQPTPL